MTVSRRTFNLIGLLSLVVPGFLYGTKKLVLKNGWVLRDGD